MSMEQRDNKLKEKSKYSTLRQEDRKKRKRKRKEKEKEKSSC